METSQPRNNHSLINLPNLDPPPTGCTKQTPYHFPVTPG
jgi:hypothetical protein